MVGRGGAGTAKYVGEGGRAVLVGEWSEGGVVLCLDIHVFDYGNWFIIITAEL
jgi:hypothetical protein